MLIRTTHYSLPEHLHEHIELVQPTTYFGRPKAMTTNPVFNILNSTLSILSSPPPPGNPPGNLMDPRLGTNCTNITTVSCIQQLYQTSGYQPAAQSKNAIGITGYGGQFANMQDLQSFYEFEVPNAVNSTFQVVEVNGACIRDVLLANTCRNTV